MRIDMTAMTATSVNRQEPMLKLKLGSPSKPAPAVAVTTARVMITQTAPPQLAVNAEPHIAEQKAEVVAQVFAYEQR
jgi:hypothetical protein